jgi:surface protein
MSLNNARHVVLGSLTNTPPTPVLPSHTIRCKFSSGYTPTMGDTQTLVDSTENVWDIYKNSTDWSYLFKSNTNLLEVVGANTSSCTDMIDLFRSCKSLTSVPLFDTSSCTNMSYMFYQCSILTSVPLFDTSSCTNMTGMVGSCKSLTSVPLFDTSSCTKMDNMFKSCYNVQSGALALYQQASTQATPPYNHSGCFADCGRDTVTGAAELAQIPQDWGGTGA